MNTNETKSVRVRFAPSPTGLLHIGSLRTALFSFLFARHNGGANVLRVEDTDQNRKYEGAIESMLEVMAKFGIEFDEGPYIENGEIKQRGDFGPYVQSQRLALYKKYSDELIAEEKAYYCFCSEQRLQELRAEQVALKKPPMYDRHCRNLPKEKVASLLKEFQDSDQKPVVRQALPESGETVVQDLVYGKVVYRNELLDDQVLLKSDGFPTYHLAVVIDDHLMEISHVIRGEEWVPSTPKHILLYEAFGWKAPEFAHLPLILNPDKTKLSKRQGDVAAEDFLQKGYLVEALLNFVALLGWNSKTEQEIFSIQELIEQFDISKINKAGAVFDRAKLDWMNSQYIRNLDLVKLTEMCLPYWHKSGVDASVYKPEFLQAIVAMEKERLKTLEEIVERTEYCFSDPEYDPALLVWKKSTPDDAKDKLQKIREFLAELPDGDFTVEKLEAHLKQLVQDLDSDNGSVLWPLRVALTGQEKSPNPFEVASTLFIGWGREVVLRRLDVAITKLA